MVLSIIGSLVTVVAIALPEILKWLEQNRTVRKAADVALTRLSIDNLRAVGKRLREAQSKTPVPPG